MFHTGTGSVSPPAMAFPRCATDDPLHSRENIVSVLRSRPAFLDNARSVHASVVSSGLLHDSYIRNLLIGMYRECYALNDTCLVFNCMHEHSTVSWTIMMAALCDHQLFHDAIRMFYAMQEHGLEPNPVTFITVLDACSGKQAVVHGKSVHAIILDYGLQGDIMVATSLIGMYTRYGEIQSARVIFDRIEPRDLFLWNTMIAGYSDCGLREQVFRLVTAMQQEGLRPNQVTHIHVLASCESPEDLEDGKYAHAWVLQSGLDTYVRVGTALVNMYGKCGSPHLARAAFNNISQHDVWSWTTMIAAHSSHGQSNEAFELFEDYDKIFQPTKATIVSVLSSCASLEQGQTVHRYAVEYEYDSDVIVGTALINMYGRCCLFEDAWVVFSKIQAHDLICMNSMMALCSQHGHMNRAFSLFQYMQQVGLEPNALTFNSLLCACATPRGFVTGKLIHECIKAKGFQSDIIVANALVNMYSKCGAWEEARAVFEKMPAHNLSSWNAIFSGCCQHGHAKDALQLFEAMQREGIEPDDITYLCLLNACSHAGLVDECHQLFLLMLGNCKIRPKLEHLTTVVGLLGRSGRLEDAEKLITKTCLKHDSAIWLTLLGACETHGDVIKGEQIAWIILNLEPSNETAYILLANLYFVTGRLHDMKKLDDARLTHGFKVTKK